MSIADQTALVTGATDGVGKLVAGALARRGVRVLLHGRSQAKGDEVLAEIRARPRTPSSGSSAPIWRRSPRCAISRRRSRPRPIGLDLLINNAGVGSKSHGVTGRELSRDGYELRFAVNYLAPFLLTHLLLPTIRRSAPARIVNVAARPASRRSISTT
ncbi:MAG: SDR family NAD(P)-dependent oxidoreductase [Pseudomonadota bacterium]